MTCLCTGWSQKPVNREVICPEGAHVTGFLTAITLVKGHSIKLASNDLLYLYVSYISLSLNLHWRSFSLQQVAAVTQTHNWSQVQRIRDFGTLSFKWDNDITHTPPMDQGSLGKRGQKFCKIQMQWDYKETIFWTQQDGGTCKLLVIVTECTRPSKVKLNKILPWRGKWAPSPTLAKIYWQLRASGRGRVNFL